ncbi:MAG TPA: ATP-binding protein [Candidatus Limnocylindrales bacterium]
MALDRDQNQSAEGASTGAGGADTSPLRLLDSAPGWDASDPGQNPLADAQAFLHALGVALYTTDAQGRITFFNEAAAALWGRRPRPGEEWCGSLQLFWPDGRPMRHDESPIARAIREDRAVRGATAHAERPDGSRVSFEAYPTPLHDANGRLVGAVNVLVDITERLAAEDFLGLVSHELRTPVTTIYGNAQLLLQRSGALPDEPRDMLADVAEDSDRLLGVIENLLLLTRAEAGTPPELEPQLLDHVLRRACEAFQKRRRRPVTFTRKPGSHVVVEADRTYLELLVGNLLSNADKYSPRSQAIDVELSADLDEARVSVLDRGIGIGASEADRIFTPFYRSTIAKRQASGMGIGLAVCKRIVEAQGGRVWARSRDGGGADVGFALPLMEDPGD